MERHTAINVNPDLASERENCPFDLEEVTNLLDGGKEETENRRKFEQFLFSKIKVCKFTSILTITLLLNRKKINNVPKLIRDLSIVW